MRAINGKSVITGGYVDSNDVAHGYVGRIGAMTSFDVPGAGTDAHEGTFPNDINVSGAVTGYYIDTNIHGFVRLSDGTFQTFDVAGTDTRPWAINNKGVVTGNAHLGGFVRAANGTITQFSVSGASLTYPVAINSGGVVAGYYDDSSNLTHGFIRARDGSITTVDVPGGFTGTYASGINSTGEVTGYTWNNTGDFGFVREPDGTFAAFNVPGCQANHTYPSAINFGGTVVGECPDGNSVLHEFLRYHDGTTKIFTAPNSAGGTFGVAISANRKSAGHAMDSNGVFHGYRLNAGK